MIKSNIIPGELLTIAYNHGLKRTISNKRIREENFKYYQSEPEKSDYVGCIAELCAMYELIKKGKGFEMSALFDVNPIPAPDLILLSKTGKKLLIDVKGTESNYKNVPVIKIEKVDQTKINAYWFFKINIKKGSYISNFHTIEEVKKWHKKSTFNNIIYRAEFT